MCAQELDRLFIPMEQFDFELHGVGADVRQPPRAFVLGQRVRAPVEVEQQLRGLVESLKTAPAHPEAATVRVKRVIGPAVAEFEPPHQTVQVGSRPVRPVLGFRPHEHGRGPRVRLDVIRVEAEAPEALEVVHGLPDHAPHGHLRDHSEDHDLGCAVHVHVATPTRRGLASTGVAGRPVCISWS